MPAYKEILNIVSQECGKETFQLTRKLFVLNGNLARQRSHFVLKPSLLWRSISRNLKEHYDFIFQATKTKHKEKLDKLRNDNGNAKIDDTKKKEWMLNLSSRKLSKDETSVLSKGMSFAIASNKVPVDQFIVETESSISSLSSDAKAEIRSKVCSILSSSKPPKSNLSSNGMKAIKTLRSEKDIIILKADKGNSTVVMDRKEYDHKIETMLSDKTTYKVLNSDPSKKCEKDLKSHLSKLKEKLPESVYKAINTTDGITPRFYGLPKIRKDGIPLRPIVSFIGSQTYQLSKYLIDR
ncbi:hypothetical protein AC249_AIPGENE14176 [Exaiptasia diaphana]|nr:hypothetical protein AC249_AIPGENE14176 [Exaiptasia diaphana]